MAPDTGFVQVIQYVKRNPKLTREQFWDQWQTVFAPKFIPFAEGSGIRRYQQVRASGKVIPSWSPELTPPNATASGEPVEFDGIIMILVPSLEVFQKAFKNPYVAQVLAPDTAELLDTAAPGGGVVAALHGTMLACVNDGASVVGVTTRPDEVKKWRRRFEELSGRIEGLHSRSHPEPDMG
ncbi:hypothetical protein LA080_010579 [Diaporthe eres]|uniref:EthD domain-containing protein n=1 Tax=Diaporthe vaccinii TaxID=105482 RepID=A0ABR4DSK8_9PEZI|nr:hypothetical protein LA080_010579 [Diaporthe eres]